MDSWPWYAPCVALDIITELPAHASHHAKNLVRMSCIGKRRFVYVSLLFPAHDCCAGMFTVISATSASDSLIFASSSPSSRTWRWSRDVSSCGADIVFVTVGHYLLVSAQGRLVGLGNYYDGCSLGVRNGRSCWACPFECLTHRNKDYSVTIHIILETSSMVGLLTLFMNPDR